MVSRPFLMAILLSVSIIICGTAQGKEKNAPAQIPGHFKIYSKDGSESLTAACHLINATQQRKPASEVTCRFTNVRFQLPSPPQYTFPVSIEEEMKTNTALAEEFRIDPVKARGEWDNAMKSAEAEFCSSDSFQKIQKRINGLDVSSRRKQLLTEALESCSSKGSGKKFMGVFNDIERSTCEVWVDHFSLDFRNIDERNWLYTQQQPSYAGSLKIYELTKEPAHNLWMLTETKMVVGQKETAESKSLAERKTWTWQNWDSYEIPEQCHFISHRLVQLE